jgi:hypothetical protein
VVDGCEALENIYYTGSAADWQSITIAEDNEALAGKTVTCNYSP